MSRYVEGDDYDEYSQARQNLWRANLRRSMASARGQGVLRDLRDALLALPEKRLIAGALCTVDAIDRVTAAVPSSGERKWGGRDRIDRVTEKVAEEGEGVCAIGALLWWRKVKTGATKEEAFAALPLLLDTDEDGDALHETATAACEAGVAYTLAWTLAYRNDETFGELTPEQRHADFLAWLNKNITAHASEPTP